MKFFSNLEHRSLKASKGNLVSVSFSLNISISSGSASNRLISYMMIRAILGLIKSYFGITCARAEEPASLTNSINELERVSL